MYQYSIFLLFYIVLQLVYPLKCVHVLTVSSLRRCFKLQVRMLDLLS